MKRTTFMVIAGEASGDWLAADLVQALREQVLSTELEPTNDYQPLYTGLAPRFFGAGGRRMAAAGVELALDLTVHSVTGISDVLKKILHLRRAFRQLYRLALQRQPDAIVCVDFSDFNRLFAHAIRRAVRPRGGWFQEWRPKIIRYVSPQVWASREGRVYGFARDHDLILSLFAFEPGWYAQRVPQLKVEFVGHPIVDRHSGDERDTKPGPFSRMGVPDGAQGESSAAPPCSSAPGSGSTVQSSRFKVQGSRLAVPSSPPSSPRLLLLPGSRRDEVRRHLPVMLGAVELLRTSFSGLRTVLVLPDDELLQQAKGMGIPEQIHVQVGGLTESLREADVAIASTGTVTLECAYWGVPTVAIYKTSWTTYEIAKRLATVKYLAMPNLLAGEEVFPEFLQQAADASNLARAAFELIRDHERRAHIKAKLAEVKSALGPPGASQRAARAIMRIL